MLGYDMSNSIATINGDEFIHVQDDMNLSIRFNQISQALSDI